MFSKQKLIAFAIIIIFTLSFILTQSVEASSNFVFNKNLRTGSENMDVKELQKFLNNNGFILNKNGAGSLGQETNFFGSITRNSLIKFQKANNIIPALGYFGPLTRSLVNKILKSLAVSSDSLANQTNHSDQVSQSNQAKQTNQDFQTSQTNLTIKSSNYIIGGSIFGIVGPVVLQNNGKDDLLIDINQNSDFTFPVALQNGANYNVTVRSKISGQICYVNNNSGVVNGTDIKSVKIACGANLSYNPFTYIPSSSPASYSLTYSAGQGGTISGANSQTIISGNSGSTVTAVADEGYNFLSWSDGALTAERTDSSIRADKSVSASFAINTYLVSFNGNGNDSGTPPTNQSKTHDVILVLSRNDGDIAKTGYTFSGWNTAADGTGIDYAAGGNYSANISITLYAKWTPELTIGSSYQGGKIAYILQAGDSGFVAGETHGLIAATANQSSGVVWAKPANQSSSVPGGTQAAIGSGSVNTDNTIAQNSLDSTYAAGIARSYAGGGYNDWYLPSQNELNKLYDNRVIIGNFTADYYWSSTEGGVSTAWSKHFVVGSASNQLKSTQWTYVRAVRSF